MDPCTWKFSRSRTQALRETDKQRFISITGHALHLTARGDERPWLFTGGTVHWGSFAWEKTDFHVFLQFTASFLLCSICEKALAIFPFLCLFFFPKEKENIMPVSSFLVLSFMRDSAWPIQIRNCHLTYVKVPLLTGYPFKGQKYTLSHTLKQQWLKFFKAMLGLKIRSLKLCIK